MKLTYDALLHVISLTSYAKDSVHLMTTCRVLYHEGPKIALKKLIRIFNEEQLISFLQFLRAQNFFRYRYVKQLELEAFYPEPEDVEVLIETLPRLVNIESLRLVNVEELLELYHRADFGPVLPPAFAALTSLRHIDIFGAKEETCSLLSLLHSPLVSLRLDFRVLSNSNEKLWDLLDFNEWSIYHPTVLLENFASTLEELQCVAWYMSHETIRPRRKVYPNMRKLSIEHCEFPRIVPFIRAFPNLTDLHASSDYWGDVRTTHNTNVAQQRDLVGGTWAHLDHFHGSLFDLYIIGLTCHVPRITITDDNLEDEPSMDMLATVLRYGRPVHLKLEGIAGSMLGDADRGFISMLRDTGTSNLINLDVGVYFRADDREKDLTGAIVCTIFLRLCSPLPELIDSSVIQEGLFLALALLPLKFLELRFYSHDLNPTPRRAQPGLPEPIPAPLTSAELSVNALDLDFLVAHVAESLATLEAAHVAVLCYPCRGGQMFEKTITKGKSSLGGCKQWCSWNTRNDSFFTPVRMLMGLMDVC